MDDVIERLMRAAVDPTGMSAQEADQMRIMVVRMLRALRPGDALPGGYVVTAPAATSDSAPQVPDPQT